jgi:hypothetical protein
MPQPMIEREKHLNGHYIYLAFLTKIALHGHVVSFLHSNDSDS